MRPCKKEQKQKKQKTMMIITRKKEEKRKGMKRKMIVRKIGGKEMSNLAGTISAERPQARVAPRV